MDLKNLALGAIPPAIIAAVSLAIMWSRRGKERAGDAADNGRAPTDWRSVVTPLVFGAVMIVTYWLVFGAIEIRPVRSRAWLPAFALAAGLAGAVAGIGRTPAVLRWLLVLGVLGGVGVVSARLRILNSWSDQQTALHVAEFMLVGATALAAAVGLARRPGVTPLLVLVIFAGGASQLLVLGHFNLEMGQVAGIGAAMLLGALVIAMWRPELRLGMGAASFVVIITLGALLQGRLYGTATLGMSRIYTAVLLVSLVGGWIALVALPLRQRPLTRAALVVAIAALPMAIAVGYAARNWLAEDTYTGGE